MKCPKCNEEMNLTDTYTEGELAVKPATDPFRAYEKSQLWSCECGYRALLRMVVDAEGVDFSSCKQNAGEWKFTRKNGQVKFVQ